MKRPRWRVRALMGVVLVVAVALGLVPPAVEVWRDPDYHFHTYVLVDGGTVSTVANRAGSSPFWPRYARRLLGRPWKGQAVCGPVAGHLGDRCQRVHPEMNAMYEGRSLAYWTESQCNLSVRLGGPDPRKTAGFGGLAKEVGR